MALQTLLKFQVLIPVRMSEKVEPDALGATFEKTIRRMSVSLSMLLRIKDILGGRWARTSLVLSLGLQRLKHANDPTTGACECQANKMRELWFAPREQAETTR